MIKQSLTFTRLISSRFHNILIQNTTRNFSVDNCKNNQEISFITTPIFYVNAQPHIGHLYTVLLADATHRYQELQCVANTSLITGTDEHGLKIQKAATAANIDPQTFCDNVSVKFRHLFDLADIKYTDYIRTTEHRHRNAVEHFYQELAKNGFIYRGNYSGWYCVSDEAFLTESQVQEVKLPNGQIQHISIESGHQVEWSEESNYMFKLSNFQDDLKYWLRDENRVRPKRFYDQLQMWLSEELPDLSVSRPRSRVAWGIPVPDDPEHTLYVWVDALVNYLTAAGYPQLKAWPPTVQILGKDILRFHGIYWPALLIAAGLEPPQSLLCHSHWTVDDRKMSKSIGNVVCPYDRIERYTSDGLRYFLLRTGTPHSDGNWSDTQVVRTLNSELADSLGNLLNRCTAPSLNPLQNFPLLDKQYFNDLSEVGKTLIELLNNLPYTVSKHYSEFNFYKGIDAIMATVRQANKFVQEEKPWELKNMPDRTKLDSVLCISLETVRSVAIALQPIVPNLSKDLLDSLGVDNDHRRWKHIHSESVLQPGSSTKDRTCKLGPRKKLFKKLKE